MIIEAILKLVFGAITWLLNLLPAINLEVGSIPSLAFLGTIRLYLNYFLTPVTASILINILLFAPMSLLVWGIIKLIRYFLPV